MAKVVRIFGWAWIYLALIVVATSNLGQTIGHFLGLFIILNWRGCCGARSHCAASIRKQFKVR